MTNTPPPPPDVPDPAAGVSPFPGTVGVPPDTSAHMEDPSPSPGGSAESIAAVPLISLTAADVAARIQGEVIGDATVILRSIAAADNAGPGDLTFADNAAHLAAAQQSGATAILVSASADPAPANQDTAIPPGSSSVSLAAKVLIRVRDVRAAIARLLPVFFPAEPLPAGIDPTARIAASARVDPTAHIGPYCVLGEGVVVGARCQLLGGNHLGPGTRLGEDCCLFPHVVLYAQTVLGNRVRIHAGTVIGSDGYGYVFDAGQQRKVLQVGNVIIHDDVEIGANTAIDRAALGSTVIGAGTKIDNLVHVAHNVVMGKHCLIMGQVGFAGSVHLDDYVVIASQSGIAGHLKLGKQSVVGAKSGVMRDIPPGGTVWGIPAFPDKQTKRQIVATQQLPDIIKRVRELEKQGRGTNSKVASRDRNRMCRQTW